MVPSSHLYIRRSCAFHIRLVQIPCYIVCYETHCISQQAAALRMFFVSICRSFNPHALDLPYVSSYPNSKSQILDSRNFTRAIILLAPANLFRPLFDCVKLGNIRTIPPSLLLLLYFRWGLGFTWCLACIFCLGLEFSF